MEFFEINRFIYQSIGIIGESYSKFDLIRLSLKPTIENDIIIPEEFLVNSIR